MYLAAIRVAQVSSSAASVDVVVWPDSVTNENGGRSSSKQRATRPSRRIDLPLMVSPDVMKITSSPSRSTQTGATCGLPSRRVTASLPVRAGKADTNDCHQPSGAAVYPMGPTVPFGAMQIVSALFVENFEMRQAPGPSTRIDLTGAMFSMAAPSPAPVTIAPHLVALIYCPADETGQGVFAVVFRKGSGDDDE